MRGSHIEGGRQGRRRDQTDLDHRKKHITSSEIFNLMNMNEGSLKKDIEELQEEQHSSNHNSVRNNPAEEKNHPLTSSDP
jgi:hypothetical protein